MINLDQARDALNTVAPIEGAIIGVTKAWMRALIEELERVRAPGGIMLKGYPLLDLPPPPPQPPAERLASERAWPR